MIHYTTLQNVSYTVYSANEITAEIIESEISGSEYFNTHYVYSKEMLKMKERIIEVNEKYNNGSGLNEKETRQYHRKLNSVQRIRKTNMSSIRCGFDIETSRVEEYNAENEIEDARSYMYHWQFSINSIIVTGRTWEQFNKFFQTFSDCVYKELTLALKRKHRKFNKFDSTFIVIWVANLPFEFQFIKDRLKIKSLFAKDRHKVVTVDINSDKGCFIQFRDCLSVTGGSLESLSKNYTTTKKNKNDINHNLKRNSLTVLSNTELSYCYNDVAILSEFHQYFYSEYKKQGYTPLTSTGILRHEVKKRQTVQDLLKVRSILPEIDEYKKIMNWLFKGGYAHANCLNVNRELNNKVCSFDITSSYPYVMLTKNFPLGKFKSDSELEYILNNIEDVNELYYYIKNYSGFFYCKVILETPNAITYNTTISLNKCMNASEILSYKYNCNTDDGFPITLIDNGRIMRTKKTVTMETDIDILTLIEMYSFDSIKFYDVMSCKDSGTLPDYLITPLKESYKSKSELKKKGLSKTIEYLLSKSKVNSGYGMTVTKMIENEITYNQHEKEWELKPNKEGIDGQLFLSPYWGIYITAYARRRLFEMVIASGNNTVVCDTDSIYCEYTEEFESIIKSENEKIFKENASRFNDSAFDDLGTWDLQSCDETGKLSLYERFATMGAKRYMLYGWNDKKYGWKQVIAGLPKGVITDYCENMKKDPLTIFLGVEGFTVDRKNSKKTTTTYKNEPHSEYVADYQGNLDYMSELSSVSIVPIPFSMSIKDMYRTVITWVLEKVGNEKTEKRIL